jgi:hypothetical protein
MSMSNCFAGSPQEEGQAFAELSGVETPLWRWQANQFISDPGLAALVMLLRFQGVGTDPEQIGHHFGGIPIAGASSNVVNLRSVERWPRLQPSLRRMRWSSPGLFLRGAAREATGGLHF